VLMKTQKALENPPPVSLLGRLGRQPNHSAATTPTLPPRHVAAGTTRRSDNDGDGRAFIHLSRGSRPSRSGEPSRPSALDGNLMAEAAHRSRILRRQSYLGDQAGGCAGYTCSPFTPPLAAGAQICGAGGNLVGC
jgi:hypothetical protein